MKQPNHIASRTPKILLIVGLSLLLCGMGYFGYRLHELSEKQEQLKHDYAEMNNIMLGIFSVDEWTGKIEQMIKKQVKTLDLSRKQEKELQEEVEATIIALINKAEALLTEPKKKTLRGKLVKFAVKNFVKVDTLKKQVPSIARSIIKKIDNPAVRKQIKNAALEKVDQVNDIEFIDSTLNAKAKRVGTVLSGYPVSNLRNFNKLVKVELEKIRKETYICCVAMLSGIVIFLMAWWVFRKRKALYATLFILSLVFAFVLLAIGLTASMIEVDARINEVDFTLLGEKIHFYDQVLFFQSKSIIDVVIILMQGSKADSVGVGVLILVFSILFPIMKLTSTGIHLLGNKKLAENKVIKYFAFQSGKWSMADVFVIGILMAYIGLNGLLEAQLAKLEIPAKSLTLISTHNTALQPGYIIFIAFVLFGLVLSTILKFISPHNSD